MNRIFINQQIKSWYKNEANECKYINDIHMFLHKFRGFEIFVQFPNKLYAFCKYLSQAENAIQIMLKLKKNLHEWE